MQVGNQKMGPSPKNRFKFHPTLFSFRDFSSVLTFEDNKIVQRPHSNGCFPVVRVMRKHNNTTKNSSTFHLNNIEQITFQSTKSSNQNTQSQKRRKLKNVLNMTITVNREGTFLRAASESTLWKRRQQKSTKRQLLTQVRKLNLSDDVWTQ